MRRLARFGVLVFGVSALASPAFAGITLKRIHFPANLKGNGGPTAPPATAPLSQRIVFEFDGKPEIDAAIAEGVRIRVDPSNNQGQTPHSPAYGTYSVDGNFLIFTPRLPTAPITDSFGPGSQNASDTSLPGMLPKTKYYIDLTIGTPNSIGNLSKIAKTLALPMYFTTVDVVAGSGNVATYFSNAPNSPPKANPQLSTPSDGTVGVDPNAFNDPAGFFDGIPASKRAPFRIRFRGPVNPSAENVSSDNIRLRGVRDQNGVAEDVPITTEIALAVNKNARADVLVIPQGLLPLGHTIVVEVSSKFQSLSGVAKDPSPDPATWKKVVRYRVADDPSSNAPVSDFILESFKNTAHQDTGVAVAGLELASWDANNSNVLRASFGFAGDGSLGRFEPPNDVHTVILDTNFQVFPLFDGSTPDAPPGTPAKGGVFNFTDFHLPSNVTLLLKGDNPGVITCLGTCLIEGRILLNGTDGTEDVTFDSAISPAPGGIGGAGGGRGGAGHPVVAPGGGQSIQFMQTPQFGQSGFAPGNKGPGGGGGGQCGCTLPWPPFSGDPNCLQYSPQGDGSRGSGGGGGSYGSFLPTAPEPAGVYVSGRRGGVGIGMHLPVVFNGGQTIPPEPAAYDGVTANCVARPNPNPTFAQAYSQGLIWDKAPLMNITTTWATTKKVTFGGNPGPLAFPDSDPENNFVFGTGEVRTLFGGQGGGGGGSRSEGLSQVCKNVIFTQLKLPFTVLDSKGGGGGGGGGAIMFQALGTLTLAGPKCLITAKGGAGAGSELVGDSSRGGAGGGGSGGAIILQSATNVIANDPTLGGTNGNFSVSGVPVVLDVSGGCGVDATILSSSSAGGTTGGDTSVIQVGDGGIGGPGIVQIHVPAGAPDMIDETKINAKVNRSMFNSYCTISPTTGITDMNPLVPMEKTPSPLTAKSVAQSTWYDLGAVTSDFRPQINTSAGLLDGPLYGVPGEGAFFTGTDGDGFVVTDVAGNIVTPNDNDFEIDSPDPQVLKADFIPDGPTWFQTVQILFQGADEDAANPGSPDLSTATGFVADPTLMNGKRFVRFQVVFDIATGKSLPDPSTPRPQMNFVRLPFKY